MNIAQVHVLEDTWSNSFEMTRIWGIIVITEECEESVEQVESD